MKKKCIAMMLSLAMIITMAPVTGAYAQTGTNDSGKAAVADDRVVVLFEDGEVDTDAPQTRAEKKEAKSAPRSKTFGSIMEDSAEGIPAEAKKEAENTLGQQAAILGESLGSNYTIEDTIIFSSEGGEAGSNTDNAIISIISSDKYSADELAANLSRNDKVAAAEPNYIFHATAMPDWNDRYLADAWQNGDKGINADKAWSNKDLAAAGVVC